MDLSEIKNLIKKTGGKYIIVENDKPKYVVMDFGEFNGIIDKKEGIMDNPSPSHDTGVSVTEKSDTNISENTEVLNAIEDDSGKKDSGEIKIEDLPF